jgi:hypothetical protein
MWEISEKMSAAPSAAVAVFPEAELERIYDESAMERKNLYMRTCRALFEALSGASRSR